MGLLFIGGGFHPLRNFDRPSAFEPGQKIVELLDLEIAVEGVEDGLGNQFFDQAFAPVFIDGFQLDLSAGGSDQVGKIADPGDDFALAQADGPAQGIADDIFIIGDGNPHRNAGALVDLRGLAGQGRDLGDDFLEVGGNGGLESAIVIEVGPLAVP